MADQDDISWDAPDLPLRLWRAARYLRRTDLQIARVAEHSGYDRQSDLSLEFRKYFGETPSEYRKRYRESRLIDKVKALLEETDDSGGVIASELGLDYSYFRNTFLEHVGQTPKEYRLENGAPPLRIVLAKHFLMYTDLTHEQIAQEVGFTEIYDLKGGYMAWSAQ